MKRSPTNPKRSKPRRGRVVDKDFLAWMRERFCLVAVRGFKGCGACLTTHHVREFGSPKNDRRTLRLCEAHHLHESGMFSIERMGKVNWQKHFGIDIEAEIARYNAEYEAERKTA